MHITDTCRPEDRRIRLSNGRWRLSVGFTLVELLVVVALIAMLIAILLPALDKARGLARTVACLSNERQLGLSMYNYASANNGYLPNNRNTLDTRTRWMGHLAELMMSPGVDWRNPELTRGIGILKIFVCPEVEKIDPTEKPAMGQIRWGYYQRISTSYASIKPFIGSGSYPPGQTLNDSKRVSQVPSPSFRSLLTGYNTDHAFAENAFFLNEIRPAWKWHRLAVIHQERATVLYADGHVEAEDEFFLHQNRKELTSLD